ncbi:MAG TPA: hypothetical protein VEK07_14685 [Polyangiaceae bacterium]|nr:hypothetical protein [Polyangiaceae bacterium]
MQSARSSLVGRALDYQRRVASGAGATIKSQLHDNPYLQLFRFRSKDILKAYEGAASVAPPVTQTQFARATRKPSESAETMKAANKIDDEWGDVTIPNHDSLIPHALTADESSPQLTAPRVGVGPLLAIGTVIAMACALPVIGWAAHRPTSANANGVEDGADPVTQVADAPTPAPRNPQATHPGPTPDAIGALPAAGTHVAGEKSHKKHAAPSKRANSDRVAGLASAVAGLAGSAAEPPSEVESAGTASEIHSGSGTGSLGATRSDRTGTDAKGLQAKQSGARPLSHATAASVEDQAAAELSSALK